jgi:hypothetical protein
MLMVLAPLAWQQPQPPQLLLGRAQPSTQRQS